MEYLQTDLEFDRESSTLTFMSDKQKGPINAVEAVFPNTEHRFCVVHLYNNMKVHHGGLLLKEQLWKDARCTRVVDFDMIMDDIKRMDKDCYKWLEKDRKSVV